MTPTSLTTYQKKRHYRVIDLRKKIQNGWNHPQLKEFCKNNLKVSNTTAISYIDEAAEPFRKKYQNTGRVEE